MLVTSDNLLGLVRSENICAPKLVDGFSLDIRLGREVIRMRPAPLSETPIHYNTRYDPDIYFTPPEQLARELVLGPGDRVLGCSADDYRMPTRYFGLVQTKGTLARLFISTTCNDGQIEPGYRGRITLELVNLGAYQVVIPVDAVIAQVFVFRCTADAPAYDGRYQDATGPTLADFGDHDRART